MQPNRRAGGRPFEARRADALDSALDEGGASDALPWKAAYHQELDLYGFSSDGAREKAAQRWAAVRRSDLEAMSLYGGNIRTKLRLCAGCSQIAGPGGGPAMRGGLTPLIPRLVRGASDALLWKAAHPHSPDICTAPGGPSARDCAPRSRVCHRGRAGLGLHILGCRSMGFGVYLTHRIGFKSQKETVARKGRLAPDQPLRNADREAACAVSAIGFWAFGLGWPSP
jgi:hypothetical protein